MNKAIANGLNPARFFVKSHSSHPYFVYKSPIIPSIVLLVVKGNPSLPFSAIEVKGGSSLM